MELSNEQVRQALLSLVAFVVAVTFHEFGHAIVADRLGDGLPRAQGRVTLSPLAHIDLVGTIIVPLMAAFASGIPFIAWGKPVMTNPSAMTSRFSRVVNNLIVSVAGPAMNLVLAVLASVVIVAVGRSGHLNPEIGVAAIRMLVMLNISLMFFNLLPIPPLDGGAILEAVLPPGGRRFMPYLRRYGMLVIILLFMTGMGSFLMWPAQALGVAWGRFLVGMIAA